MFVFYYWVLLKNLIFNIQRKKVKPKVLLEKDQFDVTIKRLCHQLIEVHNDFKDSAIIGLQPRGVFLAHRIKKELETILNSKKIHCGELDITFYRDDFRKKELIPNRTNIDFIIEDKNVILVDDVLFTGRTIRAGLDAMQAFGRPNDVELLVLVDRRFSRHVPIQAKYTGIVIDSIESQNVRVEWKETEGRDRITLLNK
jgi:pyrimidine operon attenuation protein / uracil phosphoribosyltransferase